MRDFVCKLYWKSIRCARCIFSLLFWRKIICKARGGRIVWTSSCFAFVPYVKSPVIVVTEWRNPQEETTRSRRRWSLCRVPLILLRMVEYARFCSWSWTLSVCLSHTHTHTAFVSGSSFFSHFVRVVVFCRRSLSRKFLRGDWRSCLQSRGLTNNLPPSLRQTQ
jgi:hypothetical protein